MKKKTLKEITSACFFFFFNTFSPKIAQNTIWNDMISYNFSTEKNQHFLLPFYVVEQAINLLSSLLMEHVHHDKVLTFLH